MFWSLAEVPVEWPLLSPPWKMDTGTYLLGERKESLGGILLQCTHQGFGLGYFGEDLSGLEYAERFQLKVQRTEIRVRCNTMVLRLYPNQTALLSGTDGIEKVAFDVCVLATGCRERTLYSQEISGTRPAGIMTAGTAQKLMNVDGLEIGDEIIIAGTGDVGQIMAGQLSLSGKRIIAMIEKEDHPGGLKRNQENYLKALHIPVILNSVITRVHGRNKDRRRRGQKSPDRRIKLSEMLYASDSDRYDP